MAYPGSEGGVWCGVLEGNQEGRVSIAKQIIFSMGDGRRVRFWKDKWCRNNALFGYFPSLYALAAFKEACLMELWDSTGKEGGWSPRFSRLFNDWEVERLLVTIKGRRFNFNLEDRVFWKETKDGNFSVKSLYSALDSRSAVQFPKSII